MRFSSSQVLSCSLFSLQPFGVSRVIVGGGLGGRALPLISSTVTRGCRGKTRLSMTARRVDAARAPHRLRLSNQRLAAAVLSGPRPAHDTPSSARRFAMPLCEKERQQINTLVARFESDTGIQAVGRRQARRTLTPRYRGKRTHRDPRRARSRRLSIPACVRSGRRQTSAIVIFWTRGPLSS